MQPKKGVLLELGIILALAFGVRIILDAAFFGFYGAHAASTPELWLYYGVATGKHSTGISGDPTVWMMKSLAALLPADSVYYGIVILSGLMAAISSALVYLLVREFSKGGEALWAGMVYATMVEPLTLSVAGFTHDNLLAPMMLAITLLAVRAMKNGKTTERIACAAAASVLVYLGSKVSIGVFVALGTVGFFGLSRLMSRRPGHHDRVMALCILAAFGFGLVILPTYMDYTLCKLPQGRMGSADVMPISAGNILLRYNILLALLPLGVYAALRRREYVGISYTVIGFVFAMIMDRGTRISDIGVAMLTAYAVCDWRPSWRRTLQDLCIILFILAVAIPMPWGYRAIMASALIALFLSVNNIHAVDRRIVLVVAVCGLLLALAGILVNTEKVVSDGEYRLYADKVNSMEGGKYLNAWDRGYMLEVLAGKTAASTAGTIDYRAHEAMWMPQRQACAALKRSNVDFVIFSDSYFDQEIVDGKEYYSIEGGLVLKPSDLPPIALAKHLTAYALSRRETNPELFKFIGEFNDTKTGASWGIFKLMCTSNSSYITVLALNNETSPLKAQASLDVKKFSDGKRPPSCDLKASFDVWRIVIRLVKWVLVFSLLALVAWTYRYARLSNGKRNANKNKRKNSLFAASIAMMLAAGGIYLIGGQDQGGHTGPEHSESVTYRFNLSVPNTGNITEIPLDLGDAGDIQGCNVTLQGQEAWGLRGHATFRNTCDNHLDETVRVALIDQTLSSYWGRMIIEASFEAPMRIAPGGEETINYTFTRRMPYHEYSVAYAKGECFETVPEGTSPGTVVGVETYFVFCNKATDWRDYQAMS
jgi:hypothetical protein